MILPESIFAENFKDAKVTLSYETLEKLLKKIEDKEKAAKIKLKQDYIFGNVKITGNISKKFAQMNLKVPVSIISENYVTVPMFSSDISIVKATFRGKPLSLFQKDYKICFETKKETGKPDMLEIELIVPVREKGGVQEFTLNTNLLSGGIVELGFEKEIKSIQLDGVVWQKRTGQKIKAALGRFKTLRGELATFKREDEAVVDDSKRVKKTYSTTYTLLSFEDEVATFYSSVRYKILNDQVREFKISLPENVTVNEIIGDDLEEWELKEQKNGFNIYLAKVLYPAIGKYDLSVQYEKTIKNTEDFTAPELVIKNVARNEGFIGVEMLSQAEISLKNVKKAKIIDIQELPEIIREDAYSPFVYALRYVESPYEISFEIKKHKNFQMDAAICDRLEYIHVISPQGKMLSQVRMWIRNSRKQFLSFKLPENGEILSTYLDGRSIKPSLGKEREILLPLKRQSLEPFILEVVYKGPEVSLGTFLAFSKIHHPSVDISASVVNTILYVPKDLNLKILPGVFDSAEHGMNFIEWGLNDNDSDGTRMDGRVNIQGNNVPMTSYNGNRFVEDDIIQEEPQIQEMTVLPQAVRERDKQKKGGTLSIKIDLPKHGRTFSFNTFYVPENEALSLNFITSHKISSRLGKIFIILILIISGFLAKSVIKKPTKIQLIYIALNCILIYFINIKWPAIITYIVLGAMISFFYNKYGALLRNKIKAWT